MAFLLIRLVSRFQGEMVDERGLMSASWLKGPAARRRVTALSLLLHGALPDCSGSHAPARESPAWMSPAPQRGGIQKAWEEAQEFVLLTSSWLP